MRLYPPFHSRRELGLRIIFSLFFLHMTDSNVVYVTKGQTGQVTSGIRLSIQMTLNRKHFIEVFLSSMNENYLIFVLHLKV